ncbi:hypothetical protein GCM10020358_50160 [Amorphoplanes nipponensis]|uniref:Uncharacterized protein n=1 Tax=Actinoplanes nipponensis TaxID=135950 RepID=A0A919JE22_9ACTN|nr:hypothetical protein [Actinoplanes nipponensis]GIE47476.1 hypothetical protein Ani05nite_10100 [Actinoplanes nipponensis]
MAYDREAESRKLIAGGLPARPVSLSRRRRFAPLAVDVDGDIAAARFVRRGVSCYWDETHILVYDGQAGWRYTGGGGSSAGERWSAEAFLRDRADLAPAGIEATGGSSVRDHAHRPAWIRTAELLVGGAVTTVVVDGRRRLVVPGHGRLVVVWSARQPPIVSARDPADRELSRTRPPGR